MFKSFRSLIWTLGDTTNKETAVNKKKQFAPNITLDTKENNIHYIYMI